MYFATSKLLRDGWSDGFEMLNGVTDHAGECQHHNYTTYNFTKIPRDYICQPLKAPILFLWMSRSLIHYLHDITKYNQLVFVCNYNKFILNWFISLFIFNTLTHQGVYNKPNKQ